MFFASYTEAYFLCNSQSTQYLQQSVAVLARFCITRYCQQQISCSDVTYMRLFIDIQPNKIHTAARIHGRARGSLLRMFRMKWLDTHTHTRTHAHMGSKFGHHHAFLLTVNSYLILSYLSWFKWFHVASVYQWRHSKMAHKISRSLGALLLLRWYRC